LAIADGTGAVNVWDIASWQLQKKLLSASPLLVLAMSPDNQLIAAGARSEDQVWNLTTVSTWQPFRHRLDNQWRRPSRLAACCSQRLITTRRFAYMTHALVIAESVMELLLETFALAFSPDSRHLLICWQSTSVDDGAWE